MSIEGTWYNELGSVMKIVQDGASLVGTYCTPVGDASGQYTLMGQVNTQPASGGQAAGWVVVWTNNSGTSHSVTTWSGQYFNLNGEEEIIALWLLTSEVPIENEWAATQVGQDTFKRTPFTQEQIVQAQKRRARSHPNQTTK